jgi:hypothetical protein
VTWRRVLRNRQLRRLSLAFLAFSAAEYGEWIAVLIYAYSRGGAATAGLVAAVQLVPCGLLAPVLAGLADRMAPERLLRLAYLAQAGTMLVIAVAIAAHAPPLVVYAAGALAAIPFTIPLPVQAVILPAVSVSATDLTAANVVSSWAESAGIVVGPAVTALLIGRAGSAGVLTFFAASTIGACWLVPRLGAPVAVAAPAPAEAQEPEGPTIAASIGRTLRVVRQNPSVLVLLAGAFAHFVVFGALDVLYLVLALSLLHSGQPGVGYLNAAFGAGSVLSVVLTARLVGRARFAPPMIIAAGLWGVAFLLLAAARSMLTAALLLAAAAVMSSVVEVCGKTLLQRVAPPELQASIFGLLEGASMAAFALGSLLVPALIWLLGDRGGAGRAALAAPGRPARDRARGRGQPAAPGPGLRRAAAAGDRGPGPDAPAGARARRPPHRPPGRCVRPPVRRRGRHGDGDPGPGPAGHDGTWRNVRGDRAADGLAAVRRRDRGHRGRALRPRPGPVHRRPDQPRARPSHRARAGPPADDRAGKHLSFGRPLLAMWPVSAPGRRA